MRGFAIAASLVAVLSAAPAFAQAAQPPAQPKPAQPAPAPAQPTTPAAAPALPPQPPAPFPAGAKIAWINPQRVFQDSGDGRAGLNRVQALIAKKQKEGEDKAKLLQGNQQKLSTSGAVMNDAARGQLEKEIERQQLEAQRFQQDAQAEINELQQEVQSDFVKKVTPVIEQVAKEKGLQIVFDVTNAGIAWGDPGLDLTSEVIKKLDGPKPAATPKP
jgi:outer membrane protein